MDIKSEKSLPILSIAEIHEITDDIRQTCKHVEESFGIFRSNDPVIL